MRYFLDIPRIIDGSGAHPGAASPPVEGCGEHGGEESGEPRGARWGGEWGTPWGTVGSAAGRKVEHAMEPARDAWGFCTIRRIATACRRRVASLLVQFPPSQRPERAEPNERAGTRHPPRGARREPRGAPRNPPSRWGFCTIRSIATACRRRVASLLVQFPPRGGEHAGEESGEPRGARWRARWGRERETPWGTVGSAMGRRVGNPGGHGGEARSCPHRQRSGGASTRTPATRPGNESGQSSFFRSSQRRS